MYYFQDKRITGDGELSDSEDEGEGGRRDNRSYRNQQPRKRPRLDKDGSQLKDEIKRKNLVHLGSVSHCLIKVLNNPFTT